MLGRGAMVQSINDPLLAAVSPFSGSTCRNATQVPEQLDGDLRLAFAINHAELQLLPSCFQPSQMGLWPTKSYKKGQLVLSEDGLRWHRGAMSGSGGAVALGCFS